jgi:outer membrane autotransporter protein
MVLKGPPPVVYTPHWNVWGAGFGGGNEIAGNASAGTHDTSSDAAGGAIGADYFVAPDTRLGFALAGGGTAWSVSEGLGGGHSDVFQAGIYGVHDFGPAYIAGAVAFGNYWVRTNRVAGGGTLDSNFDAQGYGGRIEGGYHIPFENVTFTPYGAVQPQAFSNPAFSEYAISGSGTAALSYMAQTGTEVRGEVGSWVRTIMPLDNGEALTLFGRAAYAHDWQTNPTLTAGFLSLAAPSFVINGAEAPFNIALVTAGAELRLSANWAVMAKFEGEFSSGYESYAGTARLSYLW